MSKYYYGDGIPPILPGMSDDDYQEYLENKDWVDYGGNAKNKNYSRTIDMPRNPMYSTRKAIAAGRSLAAKVSAKAVKSALASAKKKQSKKNAMYSALKSAGVSAGNALFPGLGTVGGAIISHMSGVGDYKIGSNSLMNIAGGGLRRYNSGDPPMLSNRRGGVRVSHREYITDIATAGTAFSLANYPINPGLSESFPWLSAMAVNFQEYRIHGMVYEFVSLSADSVGTTNTNLGSVILSTNYDSLQANYLNKSQMENSEYTTSARPSINIMHGVECDPKKTQGGGIFYVRSGSVPAGADQRLYDLGNFQIATVGQQASNTGLGELHVTYDIEFMKPQLNSGVVDADSLYYHLYDVTSGDVTAAAPLGATVADRLVSANSNIGIAVNAAGTQIKFPVGTQGNFLITYTVLGTATSTLLTPSFTPGGGAAAFNILQGEATSVVISPAGGTDNSTTLTTTYGISLTPTDIQQPFLSFGTGGTLPTTVTAMDLIIVQIPAVGY